jgi:REP element-mobilizing transposase RayT
MHTATALFAHITWATWRRGQVIRAADVPVIAGAVVAAARRCKVRVHGQAVLTDHVHIVVSFLPDASLSAFVREAKSESARRVNETQPGRLRWGRGFYAGSLSRSHVRAARVYVGNQLRRHPDRVPS